MGKHIHIWLHRAPARDAFEESKHKRDEGGRFSTVPGKGDPNFHKAGINHSPAMKHHGEAEAHHHTKAQEEFAKNGDTPLHQAHKTAAQAHSMALEEAKQRATGFSGEGYENAAKKAAAASKATQPLKTKEDLHAWAASKGIPKEMAEAQFNRFHEHGKKLFPKLSPEKLAHSTYTTAKSEMMTRGFAQQLEAHKQKSAKPNPLTDKPAASSFEPGQKEMEKHPNYNKDDHEYLKGKGWTNSQIHQRWTAEHKAGQGAASGKVKAPDVVGVVANPNFYKK